MKKRDYRDYVQDILDSINDAEAFIKGMKFSEFKRDKKTINAVVRSVEVIGEAAKKIPKSLRKEFPTIPWKRMLGIRDKLIHEYFGIDVEILWEVVKKDLPGINPEVSKMRKMMNKGDKR